MGGPIVWVEKGYIGIGSCKRQAFGWLLPRLAYEEVTKMNMAREDEQLRARWWKGSLYEGNIYDTHHEDRKTSIAIICN